MGRIKENRFKKLSMFCELQFSICSLCSQMSIGDANGDVSGNLTKMAEASTANALGSMFQSIANEH